MLFLGTGVPCAAACVLTEDLRRLALPAAHFMLVLAGEVLSKVAYGKQITRYEVGSVPRDVCADVKAKRFGVHWLCCNAWPLPGN